MFTGRNATGEHAGRDPDRGDDDAVEVSDYASSVVPQGGLVDDMATISDVAALAGVGIGTVSRVLNGSHQVRPTTRAKVHAAMEELDYRPTRSSAGGTAKRQGFVGVLVPFFDEPSSYQRLRGIVQSLQPHGLEIVLYNVDAPDRARRRLVEVPRHQLDGLIIIALPLRSDEGDRLAQAQFPTVLIDTSHPALPSVLIDDRRGGRIATEHLLSLGHERIAFIGEPERNPFGFVSSRYRQEGYTGALADAGVAFDLRYVKHGPHVRTAARQLASELFAMTDPPTAVVAASDVQALGVLEAARLAGKAVPRDVSIIGYDDIDLAAYSGLTTVRQPLEVSGQRGSEILTGALATGIRPIPFVEELAIELVVRGTTSAPPRASKVGRNRRDGTPMVVCAFRPPIRNNTVDGTPAWWETAVVYQLYVRSFADSNDDGIGDLAGIRSRLPYLADLGIDAIWLNPCYPSPQADHGYDVADYFDIEPDYGDLDEFDALVREARAVGIRIMMDVVPNHCSSEHAWFRAALGRPARIIGTRAVLLPRRSWRRWRRTSEQLAGHLRRFGVDPRRRARRLARPVVPRRLHAGPARSQLEPSRRRRSLRPHAPVLVRPRRRGIPRRRRDGGRQDTGPARQRVAAGSPRARAGRVERPLHLAARGPCRVAPLASAGRRLRGRSSGASAGARRRGVHPTPSRRPASIRQ